MRTHHETLTDAVALTISDDELGREFDSGFGLVEGCPFTVWTARRVYFPTVYDGAERCSSVSRHPDGIPTGHVG